MPFTGLCFTALKPLSVVRLLKSGSPSWTGEYSLDGDTWTSYIPGTTGNITLANTGDKVYFRGTLTSNNSTSKYLYFDTSSGEFACSGNINSMYSATDYETLTKLIYTYCFYYMFRYCKITTPPELPATTLSSYCYAYMFGSTSLTTTPELPATKLATSCYHRMFMQAQSLKSCTDLPASELQSTCYEQMFYRCCSLIDVPTFPKIASAYSDSFRRMFGFCVSLKRPAHITFESSVSVNSIGFEGMYENCWSLEETDDILQVPESYINWYRSTYSNCSNLKAIKWPNNFVNIQGFAGWDNAFYGCKKLSINIDGTGILLGKSGTVYNKNFDDSSAVPYYYAFALTKNNDDLFNNVSNDTLIYYDPPTPEQEYDIKYKGNVIGTTNEGPMTLKTSGKYLEDDIILTVH